MKQEVNRHAKDCPAWFLGSRLARRLLAIPLAFASSGRSDCPGKVVCPLTGEEVCKDQCPLAAKKTDTKKDVTRADCPGQIECPLTGELVCRDKCPVAHGATTGATKEALVAEEEAELPPCCRKK